MMIFDISVMVLFVATTAWRSVILLQVLCTKTVSWLIWSDITESLNSLWCQFGIVFLKLMVGEKPLPHFDITGALGVEKLTLTEKEV